MRFQFLIASLLVLFFSPLVLSSLSFADEKFVSVNGINIHYIEQGEKAPDRPLILFLHGAPERAEAWAPYLEAFKDKYHAVAYTMRGTYPSTGTNNIQDFKIENLTKDALLFVNALGYGQDESFYLVGHDWGASTAWRVTMAASDRIKKLIVMSVPHPVVYSRGYFEVPEHKEALDGYIKPIRAEEEPWTREISLLDDAKWFQGLVFTEESGLLAPQWKDLRDLYISTWTHNNGASIQSVYNLYHALDTYPPMSDVPSKARPKACKLKPEVQVNNDVLFFYGGKDPYFAYQVMDEVSNNGCSPNMTSIFIEEADHWVNHSHKEEIIPLIKAFIEE